MPDVCAISRRRTVAVAQVELHRCEVERELRAALARPPAVDAIAGLIDLLRPTRRGPSAAERLGLVLAVLEREPELTAALRARIADVLTGMRLVYLLVESGVLQDLGVGSVLARGASALLLPPVPPADDLRGVVPRLFRRADDWRWVRAIPTPEWARLIRLCLGDSPRGLHEEVDVALRALALRIGGAGIHEELEGKLAHVDIAASPFLELPIAADRLLQAARGGSAAEDEIAELRAHVVACRKLVRGLREDKRVHGASLRLTRLTRRMDQQLTRLELLMCLVRPRDEAQRSSALASLLKDLVEAEQAGGRVTRRLAQGVDLLAYQVTEHTAAKGEKYLGGDRRDWWRVLGSALGGGAIVGVFAILKLFASKLDLALAAEAVVYGANYAICFAAIYLTGATLATKQPAITASAIAKQLDTTATRREGLDRVAETVVGVWRTQFVSFLGNLLFAFPAAMLFGLAVEQTLGSEMVSTDKARQLLEANHAFEGPTLFYAAIAGLLLFLSGLLQGIVDNRVVYTGLEARLAHHPRLRWLGGLRQRLAGLVARHAGGLTSNVALGFALGSAGVVGEILGLPIDIRHIAFSSAHVGVAMLDSPSLFDAQEGGLLLIGVLAIGFVNFLVSFGLTLAVTLKSRNVTVTQGGALLMTLARRFVASPLLWFYPVERSEPR